MATKDAKDTQADDAETISSTRSTPSNKALSPVYMLVASAFPDAPPIVYTEISQALDEAGFKSKDDFNVSTPTLRKINGAIQKGLTVVARGIVSTEHDETLGKSSDDVFVKTYTERLAVLNKDLSKSQLIAFAVGNCALALKRALGGDAHNLLTQAHKKPDGKK